MNFTFTVLEDGIKAPWLAYSECGMGCCQYVDLEYDTHKKGDILEYDEWDIDRLIPELSFLISHNSITSTQDVLDYINQFK